MKLQNTTMRVICGTMALVLATTSAAAATADSLPPMSEYHVPAGPSDQQETPAENNPADKQEEQQEKEEEKNYIGKKSETVYVNLHADGSVRETIVTDWLHSDTADAQLPDRTDLGDITNVKGTETPQRDGNSLTWNLDGKDLYYRGNTSKPLPLDVSITYFIDGKEYSPDEMAGKSGKLEIKLHFNNTTSHNVTISGKQTVMQTPLMVIAGMSLSNDHFSNVDVSDGTVVSDGSSQVVSIVCMPGLQKSLNIGNYSLKEINDMDFPEDFTITANVENFEMGPIGIAVTSELPNLEDIKKSDDIDDMRQDLYDLQDMQNDLDRVDPDRDLRSLITDPERTEASQLLVDDIFTFYDLNKDILDILPKYITEDNIKLYDRIKYDLKDSTLDTLLDDDVVSDLLDLVDEISPAKLQSLADDFDNLDLKALRTLLDRCNELSGILGVSDTQKQIATLKKLAACREPMVDLLNDAQSLNDKAFGQLMMASIVSQIPGTGTMNAEMQTLLGYLLKDKYPSLLGEIGKDMAEGYTTGGSPAGIAAPDLDRTPKQPAPSDLAEEGGNSGKPDADEANESQPEENESKLETDETDPSESSESQAPEKENDANSESSEDSKPSSDASHADSDKKSDSDSKSDTQDSSKDAAGSEPRTAVLAAFVEKDASSSEAPEVSESEPETQSEPQVESEPEKPAQEENSELESKPEAEDAADSKVEAAAPAYNLGSGQTPRMEIIGALSTLFNDENRNDTFKKLESIKDDSSIQSIVTLRKHSLALADAMTEQGLSPDDLPEAIAFADSMLTKVNSLQSLVDACFAPLTKNVTDPAKKAEIIQKAMKQITEDLSYNKENFTSMILLMDKLKKEKLLDDIEYIDDLRKDMQDLRPIVKDLNRDLDKNYINISLHESPKATTTLLKMKDDLEKHRDISESLRTAMLPENIDIGRSMIETLDRLQDKDAVGNSLDKMDDADELLDRKEALVDLSEQYRIFTDAPEELDTELKFVMKTDEIELPEEDEEVEEPEEDKGFFEWCKDVFHNLTSKKK